MTFKVLAYTELFKSFLDNMAAICEDQFCQSINDSLFQSFVKIINNSNFDISKHVIPQVEVIQDTKEHRDLLRRMQGSLIGLAVGDAVGGPYEFESRNKRVLNPAKKMISGGSHNLAKGEWTDDTSMALCLAVSLLCSGGGDQYDQLMRYSWWWSKGYLSSRHECFDVGNLTGFALREFMTLKSRVLKERGFIKGCSEEDLNISSEIFQEANLLLNCGTKYPGRKAGNGSLMRLAPVPLFFFGQREKAIAAAAQTSLTTHDDPIAVEACMFYTALIMGALEGLSKDEILKSGFYEDYSKGRLKNETIIAIANGSYKVCDSGSISGSGYVAHSLEAALWALYNDGGSFETGVFLAINLGDDTDTTAAIYGQLAGALYGLDGIPGEWRRDVLHADAIGKIAAWLFHSNEKVRSKIAI